MSRRPGGAAVRARELRRRDGGDDRERDRGFTLVEMVIALVLSSIIAGVTVSAMLTSMHVIDSTNDQMHGSTDAGLLSAWFYRDAQAAGGMFAGTGAGGSGAPGPDVSVTDDAGGWRGCLQSGELVVRFGWVDQIDATTSQDVVVTYALQGTTLSRRACAGAATSVIVLGDHVASAVATCAPDPGCAGTPEQVSLRIIGNEDRVAVDHTVTATLREVAAPDPVGSTTMPAPVVVLGGAPCPSLALTGGVVTVTGDAVVGGGCGPSTLTGTTTNLHTSGVTTMLPGAVDDPLAGLAAPDAQCGVGHNPPVLGVSPAPDAVVVHPEPVTITGAVAMQPGRYVFCQGLTIAAGASVIGQGITLVVAGGDTLLDSGAVVDLAAPTAGDLRGLVLWARSPGTVSLAFGPGGGALRGVVDAPGAHVAVATATTASIGGLVAQSAELGGAGSLLVG